MKFPRIRYAGIVAALGLAAGLLPGLAVETQALVQAATLWLAGLLAVGKLLIETMAQVDSEDPTQYHTMQRGATPSFWRRVL